MAENIKRVLMQHGALGVRPTPEAAPQQLHVGGVYDVPAWLGDQLAGANFATVVDRKEHPLRDGDPGSSPGAKACPECGAQIVPQAKFCTECGTGLTETRRPSTTKRDPAPKA
jgi:hypothetical protein